MTERATESLFDGAPFFDRTQIIGRLKVVERGEATKLERELLEALKPFAAYLNREETIYGIGRNQLLPLRRLMERSW